MKADLLVGLSWTYLRIVASAQPVKAGDIVSTGGPAFMHGDGGMHLPTSHVFEHNLCAT